MANLDIPIKIPTPATKTSPSISIPSFPPSLPSVKLPAIPPAVAKAQSAMTSLVSKFQKLAGLVGGLAAGQTITLILKRGTTTVFSQKVSASSVAKKFL